MIYKVLKPDAPAFAALDEGFVKKEIEADALYRVGILPSESPMLRVECKKSLDRSIVLPMAYGNSYELRFAEDTRGLCIVSTQSDPRTLAPGQSTVAKEVRIVRGVPKKEDLCGLLYTPKHEQEYLVLNFGDAESAPVRIYEHCILAEEDTAGPWYRPSVVGDFLGGEGSFGDYRWSSDEIYGRLYEPLREKYPSYIRREHIGKDQSGAYDMYCYIFEPEDYGQTVFLSAGMHANEEDAYFALAYFMSEVANASGKDAQLKFLRERVRFIVVPLINVFGVNQTHILTKANWSIRYNSTGTDLNRDFDDQTQQETKNVAALLAKYADGISFGIDYHTTPNDNGSDLFFNFTLSTDNEAINRQTVNHIYHRMREEGMITEKRPLLVPSSSAYGNLAAMDGKYSSSRTLQAYLWNEHGIPPLTLEYMSFTSGKSPAKGSAEGLSMAVEILAAFVIQNALFYEK